MDDDVLPPDSWLITVERNDGKVLVHKQVPNDELEYGIDDILGDVRYQEGQLP